LNQIARALLREFRTKDSLCDSEAMSEIDHHCHELIRRQSRSEIRRSQEVPEKLSTIATLLSMRLYEAFSNGFTSKSSDLEFSTKHNPIMVRHQVGKGVAKFLHTLFRGRLVLQQRPKEIHAARLFLLDDSDKERFLSVEVGVKGTPRVSGIFGDLLRYGAAKPETQKVLTSHGDQCGAGLRLAFLTGEPLSRPCGGHKRSPFSTIAIATH
jgi:hypothetical protein